MNRLKKVKEAFSECLLALRTAKFIGEDYITAKHKENFNFAIEKAQRYFYEAQAETEFNDIVDKNKELKRIIRRQNETIDIMMLSLKNALKQYEKYKDQIIIKEQKND